MEISKVKFISNKENKIVYSEGYKLLLRFLKETRLYMFFLEYQQDRAFTKVKEDSDDIMASFGKSQFTYWLASKKKIGLKRNVYFIFIAWLTTFYPRFKMYETCPIDNLSEYGISTETRTIDFSVNKHA